MPAIPEPGIHETQPPEARSARFRSSDANLKFWTNLGILNALLIGLLIVYLHGGRVTTGITWSGASLALGGMLGFLFGIPGRSQGTIQINQPGVAAIDTDIRRATGTGGSSGPEVAPATAAPAPPAAHGAPPTHRSSPSDFNSDPSNLEQVSDWVTKLLLGGSLTQLQRIPSKVWELAYSVGIGIDPTAAGQEMRAQQSFAAGLLIYFFVAGFFAGYLITKLQLGRKLR